jgi:hypothetical protein
MTDPVPTTYMSSAVGVATKALYDWVHDNKVEIHGATPSMLAQVATQAALKSLEVDPAALEKVVAQRLWQVRPLTADNLQATARLVVREVLDA